MHAAAPAALPTSRLPAHLHLPPPCCLARQVALDFEYYAKAFNLTSVCLYGGTQYGPQASTTPLSLHRGGAAPCRAEPSQSCCARCANAHMHQRLPAPTPCTHALRCLVSVYCLQESILRRGVDIVIGTPGRVKDHLERGTLNLRCDTHAAPCRAALRQA